MLINFLKQFEELLKTSGLSSSRPVIAPLSKYSRNLLISKMPFSNNYFSQLNPRFSFEIDHKIGYSHILLRDGLIDLLMFALGNGFKKKGRGHVIIPYSFRRYLSPELRRSSIGFELVHSGFLTQNKQERSDLVLVIPIFEDELCKTQLENVRDLAKGLNVKVCILWKQNYYKKSIPGNLAKVVAEQTLVINSVFSGNVSFISISDVISRVDFSKSFYHVYDQGKLHIGDNFLIHHFLGHNGLPIDEGLSKYSADMTDSAYFPVSPYHGIRLRDFDQDDKTDLYTQEILPCYNALHRNGRYSDGHLPLLERKSDFIDWVRSFCQSN